MIKNTFYLPKFIAHRGLSSCFHENTINSFLAAAKNDYFWGIETDIYRDLDNTFWCSHDNDPFLMNKNQLLISDSYSKDIKNYLLDVKKTKFKINTDQYLTTIDQFLLICKQYYKHAVIEIKQGIELVNNKARLLDQTDIDDLIDLIINLNMINHTTLITFKSEYIEYICNYNNKNKTNILFQQLIASKNPVNIDGNDLKKTYAFIDKCINKGYNLDLQYDLLNTDIVNKAHSKNLIINCWTVDNCDHLKKIINVGVDQITTNVINKI